MTTVRTLKNVWCGWCVVHWSDSKRTLWPLPGQRKSHDSNCLILNRCDTTQGKFLICEMKMIFGKLCHFMYENIKIITSITIMLYNFKKNMANCSKFMIGNGYKILKGAYKLTKVYYKFMTADLCWLLSVLIINAGNLNGYRCQIVYVSFGNQVDWSELFYIMLYADPILVYLVL